MSWPKGRSHTLEQRAKMAAAIRGRKHTPEARKKQSAARKRWHEKTRPEDRPNWKGGRTTLYKREYHQVHSANQTARKYGVPSTLTFDEWLEVIAEFNHRCAYCLGPWDQLDHVQAMSNGGANERGNVAPACGNCNRRKKGRNTNWLPSIASRFWPRLAEELYT